MRIPDALLVELLSAAAIILEHDEPFWYAIDAHTGEPLAQGSDAGRVARESLMLLRQRLDRAEAAGQPRDQQRALGSPMQDAQ
jgi:hypothetical protein